MDSENNILNDSGPAKSPSTASSLHSTELPELPELPDVMQNINGTALTKKIVTADVQPPHGSSTTAYSSDELPDVTDIIAYDPNAVLPVGMVFSSSKEETVYRSKLRPAPTPRRLNTNGRSKRNIETINYADTSRTSKLRPSTKPPTTSNRPGLGPSEKLFFSRQHKGSRQAPKQTYSIIPIKSADANDNDSNDTVNNNAENHQTDNKSLPSNIAVTSDNDDLEEDDLPLSQLRDKILSTKQDNSSSTPTTSGKFKLKTIGIPIHRKADKICPICKIAKTSTDSLRTT